MMDTALLFQLVNGLALLAWLPLWAGRRWRATQWLIRHKPVPTFLGLCYLALFVYLIFGSGGDLKLDFSSLEGVKALFAKDEAVLLGWIHYLAFDMLVGIMELEDAEKRNIPHWQLLPCLIFTFALGPIGWICYWVLRSQYKVITPKKESIKV